MKKPSVRRIKKNWWIASSSNKTVFAHNPFILMQKMIATGMIKSTFH